MTHLTTPSSRTARGQAIRTVESRPTPDARYAGTNAQPSTQDIDFWMGQQAVMRLCKECKYPPTIAEFREKAKDVADDIEARISQEWGLLKLFGPRCKGGIEAYIDRGSALGEVVRMMGGVDALFIEDERGSHWNYDGFKAAYTALIRKDPALAGGTSLVLPAGRKEIT